MSNGLLDLMECLFPISDKEWEVLAIHHYRNFPDSTNHHNEDDDAIKVASPEVFERARTILAMIEHRADQGALVGTDATLGFCDDEVLPSPPPLMAAQHDDDDDEIATQQIINFFILSEQARAQEFRQH